MEKRYTPGPWTLCAHLKDINKEVECSCGYRGVVFGPESSGFAVCQPGHEPPPEGQEGTEPQRYDRMTEIANAHLIAAAPDLLEALEACKEMAEVMAGMTGCRGDDDWVWGIQAKIEAAIRKAYGEEV